MKSIAIITARSGSKGLKDKNIKMMNGKPMLAYTIEAALDSGKYDCVHVSTDSEIYAKIAAEYGAEQLFLRSPELASDMAGSWDVVRWVLDKYKALGREYDMVTLLQPTSPLRNSEDILVAYDKFQTVNADAVIAVCEMDHSPLWSNELPEDGTMKGFLDKVEGKRRQDLPTYYRINGALYMLKTEVLYKEPFELYGEKTYAYVMPKERSVDIDDEIDFTVAETIMSRRSCQ